MALRLALYQPDIPQNCGAAMRLAACMGLPLDLIGPMGFIWDEARVRRVAMDYIDHVAITHHASWDAFQAAHTGRRLILLTTRAATFYTDVVFTPDDTLLLGRESSGVDEFVHEAADLRVKVPMPGGARSLNVAMAGAMVVGEAMRQLRAAG